MEIYFVIRFDHFKEHCQISSIKYFWFMIGSSSNIVGTKTKHFRAVHVLAFTDVFWFQTFFLLILRWYWYSSPHHDLFKYASWQARNFLLFPAELIPPQLNPITTKTDGWMYQLRGILERSWIINEKASSVPSILNVHESIQNSSKVIIDPIRSHVSNIWTAIWQTRNHFWL